MGDRALTPGEAVARLRTAGITIIKERTGDGTEIQCRCPGHPDPDGHLYVNAVTGAAFCQKCKQRTNLWALCGESASLPPEEVLRHEILAATAAYYHSHLTEEARRYLVKERCLLPKVLDRFQVGWADGGLRRHLLEEKGFSSEACVAAGVLKQDDHGLRDFFYHRIIFPNTVGGRVVHLSGRRIDGGKPKWMHLPGEIAYPFNADALREPDCIWTEGILDVLSAACWDIPAAAGLGTHAKPEWVALVPSENRVIVTLDGDTAGSSGSLTVAELLGDRARIASLPAGKDPNDLLVEGRREEFEACVRQAVDLLTFRINQIPVDTPRTELPHLLGEVLKQIAAADPASAEAYLGVIQGRFCLKREEVIAYRKMTKGLRASAQRVALLQAGPVAGKADSTLPQIQINNRQLRDIVRDAWAVIQVTNDPPVIFQRSGGLVRLYHNFDARQGALGPRIEIVVSLLLYHRLAHIADWVKVGSDGVSQTFPSKMVADVMVTCPDSELPVLETVVTAPIFSNDGELIDGPGYHAAQRLWYEPAADLDVSGLPDNPSPEEVAAARDLLLEELLVDFPFVAQSDRAHVLAALLQPAVRQMISGPTPCYDVEAPKPSTGKGLLCNAISIIHTGFACDARTIPGQEDEVRKMITAELATGRPLVLLDNADEKRTLRSPALASVLTFESWTDRVLGYSRMVTLPNRALWMLTGNNPKFNVDMARRCVRIRLDPKTDRPWWRTGFKHDPLLAWVRENRSRLLRAVFTLVTAWIAAGRPLGRKQLGSFESWSAVLGGILGVAGIRGFLEHLEEFHEAADAEGNEWREFVAAWWDVYRDRWVAVKDLLNLALERDLLGGVIGDKSPHSQSVKLGLALSSVRDAQFGEWRVEWQIDPHTKSSSYRVVRPGSSLPQDPDPAGGRGMSDPDSPQSKSGEEPPGAGQAESAGCCGVFPGALAGDGGNGRPKELVESAEPGLCRDPVQHPATPRDGSPEVRNARNSLTSLGGAPAGCATEDPAEVPQEGEARARPCYTCHGRRFWQDAEGTWHCGTCHPPANEVLVAEWRQVGEKSDGDDASQEAPAQSSPPSPSSGDDDDLWEDE